MAATEADYIIVGGGLTGCALASRLQQGDPSLTILVLEAGIDASDNPQTRTIEGAFALAGSELDYNYQTLPQSNTADRVHTITAGKVLGGGSILNYGGWARGDAQDYDQWAATVGDDRWSYNGMLPYFRSSEDHFQADQNPEHRGSHGPIRVTSVLVSDPLRKYGLREPVKLAWEELGLKQNPRGDCGSLIGICEFLENWKDGQRQPSNLAYSMEGIQVITGAVAHKIIWSHDRGTLPTASGVLLTDGRQFRARKEIILTAGTIRTPQLLMLSGIGANDVLSRHGIPVTHDNPEVGKNYFDHFAHFQLWKLRDPAKGLSMGTPRWDNPAFYKGLPCDWAVNEAVPPQLLKPALEADAAGGKGGDESLLNPSRCLVETMVVYSPVGAPVPVDGSYVSTSVMLLLPTSRGSVNIVSASPNDVPAIDTNFYDTEVDRAALIHGTRRAAKALVGTTAGKSYIESEVAPPGLPTLHAESSDVDVDTRIRAAGISHAHSAGTAAMGKVVDTKLRVKGVEGLRVADASVLPVPIGGHPQATLYGLAEQAASMILQKV
ncbi:MAG: hypothetical protein L6R39_005125 [Caloplaca ligustica]|nr:MAG: hypothetical protein L6R39_005125 [Caloplaca ligustica]